MSNPAPPAAYGYDGNVARNPYATAAVPAPTMPSTPSGSYENPPQHGNFSPIVQQTVAPIQQVIVQQAQPAPPQQIVVQTEPETLPYSSKRCDRCLNGYMKKGVDWGAVFWAVCFFPVCWWCFFLADYRKCTNCGYRKNVCC